MAPAKEGKDRLDVEEVEIDSKFLLGRLSLQNLKDRQAHNLFVTKSLRAGGEYWAKYGVISETHMSVLKGTTSRGLTGTHFESRRHDC